MTTHAETQVEPNETVTPTHGPANATLPPGAEGLTIAGMKVGETAYAVPWAMVADSDRLLWLHPDSPVEKRPCGTVEMQIRRETDGFVVWFVAGHRYRPMPGLKTDVLLPVVELVGARSPSPTASSGERRA